MKRVSFIFIIIFLISAAHAFAQSFEDKQITQEEFACELVRTMNLQSWLPLSALPRDCLSVLEQFGISPIKGWDNNAYLTKEDYLVILSKAHGKEILLYETADSIEKKNIALINSKWQQAYEKEGSWPSLESLLNNSVYFPNGTPKSPYGHSYEDANNDHLVDQRFLPFLSLMELRKALSYYQ